MKLTKEKLEKMLALACKHGACEEEIGLIKSLTISEILEHRKLPYWCYWYACYVLKSRWPEGEECIKKDLKYAYWYARDVLNSRWPEAEEFIKKVPEYAYRYAGNVLKSRWHEVEEYIKKDPKYACWYASYILKSRWPEAEECIKKDEYWWNCYQKEFGIK